jgi:hypothetical protein
MPCVSTFLKARAHDHGLEPFLSLSKIAKRLEPSSPEPRIRSTTIDVANAVNLITSVEISVNLVRFNSYTFVHDRN